MCGIVAIYTAGQPVNAESLARAVTRLAPRGPDEQHTWISADGRVGVAHARLFLSTAPGGG